MNFTRYRVLTHTQPVSLQNCTGRVEMNFTRYRVLTQFFSSSRSAYSLPCRNELHPLQGIDTTITEDIWFEIRRRNELHPLQGIDTITELSVLITCAS